jgi:hypothetical protein
MLSIDLLLRDLYPNQMLSPEAHSLAKQEAETANAGTEPRAFVCVETPDASPAAVRAALVLRVPVYFGEPQRHLYRDAMLQQYLGYTTKNALQAADGLAGAVRLAIAGPLHHMPSAALGWAVHAYAPNLESVDTRDYRNLVDMSGALRPAPYKLRCNQLMSNVRTCVHEALRRSNVAIANVFMPAMGLGAYLTSLSAADTVLAIELCAVAVAEEWATAAEHGIVLHLCLFDPSAYNAFAALSLDNFGIVVHGPGAVAGNLFNKLVIAHSTGALPIFVNAWDDRAFVGNGGVNDQSVDGFFVGGYGPNRELVNGSYAHNPFLQPHLLDPRGWCTTDDVMDGRIIPQLPPAPFIEFQRAVSESL